MAVLAVQVAMALYSLVLYDCITVTSSYWKQYCIVGNYCGVQILCYLRFMCLILFCPFYTGKHVHHNICFVCWIFILIDWERKERNLDPTNISRYTVVIYKPVATAFLVVQLTVHDHTSGLTLTSWILQQTLISSTSSIPAKLVARLLAAG